MFTAMIMNETFNVATLFHCTNISQYISDFNNDNTLWKQTVLGCKIVQLLQDVHGFSVNYVYQQQDLQRDVTTEIKMYYRNSTSVDFYARPMSLRADVLALSRPIGAIFDWDFGFTISHPDVIYRNFYSKPFTRRLWNLLYGMALFCSTFFYLLKRWENKIQKGGRKWECSFGYELLMVIGAYCQHIPPIEARIMSRRTAYFVFFIFAYVVYTYYTSNLLSHLVNDKNYVISLQELLDSDIECVVLKSVKPILNNNIASIYRGDRIGTNYQKLLDLRPVSMEEGLKGVKTTKTALLTDYVTLAPYIRKVFSSNEICNLAQIDVVVKLKKYLFVSKTFSLDYMEHFKLSILRAKESGILNRLVDHHYSDDAMECTPPPHVQTQFLQIVYPLTMLMGAYVLCLIILAVEKWYFNKYRVWPYVN